MSLTNPGAGTTVDGLVAAVAGVDIGALPAAAARHSRPRSRRGLRRNTWRVRESSPVAALGLAQECLCRHPLLVDEAREAEPEAAKVERLEKGDVPVEHQPVAAPVVRLVADEEADEECPSATGVLRAWRGDTKAIPPKGVVTPIVGQHRRQAFVGLVRGHAEQDLALEGEDAEGVELKADAAVRQAQLPHQPQLLRPRRHRPLALRHGGRLVPPQATVEEGDEAAGGHVVPEDPD